MDEIDGKQANSDEITIDELAEAMTRVFGDFEAMPLILFDYSGQINRKTWLLLFHTPDKIKKQRKKKGEDKFKAPFEDYTADITDNQILEIYDMIPKSITNANDLKYVHPDNYAKLAKWFIEYKQNGNNDKIKEKFDKIYDCLIGYAYWILFKQIVDNKDKSVDEAVKFYEKYRKYINLNQKRLFDGCTVKEYILLRSLFCPLTLFMVFVICRYYMI